MNNTLKQLELFAFQGHEHLIINFVDGINVLFGATGCLSQGTFILYDIVSEQGKSQNTKGGTIKNLYHRFNKLPQKGRGNYFRKQTKDSKFFLASINENNMIFKNEIINVIDSGKKEVFEVTVENKFKIKATKDHKFYIGDGKFKSLEQLKEEDKIYIHNNCRIKKQGKSIRHKTIMIKYHPYGSIKIVNGCKYYRVTRSHIVYEAWMNGLSFEEYRGVLNSDCSKLKNLKFIDVSNYVIHHKNRIRTDDNIKNLQLMTKKAHGELHIQQNIYNLRCKSFPQKIINIQYIGIENTFDIEMKSPYNNFVANGFVVHNSGKSAVRKSLEALYFNSWEKGFRKLRTKTTTIRATLNNRIIVERIKSNSINRYILKVPGQKDKDFDAIGKTVPEQIQKILGVDLIRIGDDNLNLNVSEQITLPFLLNKRPTFRMQLFNKLTNSNIIDKCLQSFNKTILNLSRKEKSEIEQLETNKTNLQEITEEKIPLQKKVDLVNSYYTKLKTKNERYEKLKEFSLQLETITKEFTIVNQNLKNIKTIDDKTLIELDTKIERHQKLKTYSEEQLNIKTELTKANQTLTQIKTIEDNKLDEINTKIEKYNKLTQLLKDYQEIKTELKIVNEKLPKIKVLDEKTCEVIQEKIDKLDRLSKNRDEDIDLAVEIVRTEKRLKELEEQIKEDNQEYKQLLKEGKVCPLCQNEINEEVLTKIKL